MKSETVSAVGNTHPAGPLFGFLISLVVLFFPSQPGTSCRGNDNVRGKQHWLITSPPTGSHLPLRRLFISLRVSPFLAVSYMRATIPDPLNWHYTLSRTNLRGSFRFSFFSPFPSIDLSSVMPTESRRCPAIQSPQWGADCGKWAQRTLPKIMTQPNQFVPLPCKHVLYCIYFYNRKEKVLWQQRSFLLGAILYV